MRPVLSAHRCPNCEIRKPLCFCAMIPQLARQTRVIILMHTCEEVLTTNTARLANAGIAAEPITLNLLPDGPPTAVVPKSEATVKLIQSCGGAGPSSLSSLLDGNSFG